ncbi:hypothetical protein [Clostridium sp. C105KSO13]|uniref:hypothetical protein n=1 Tax=Clostridium sp. C105KSO13 TaxID=1776045 RepID=UPI000B7F919C|nr:hypothetical protein [Clostridium sp. C105KSO13]
METTHCSADAKHIRRFLNTCDGNWHSCIYVSCTFCQTPGLCKERDFLFLPDEEGIPSILPISDAKFLFSRIPEPMECLSVLTVAQFLSMYQQFFKQRQFSSNGCPCMSLLHAQEEACYDW